MALKKRIEAATVENKVSEAGLLAMLKDIIAALTTLNLATKAQDEMLGKISQYLYKVNGEVNETKKAVLLLDTRFNESLTLIAKGAKPATVSPSPSSEKPAEKSGKGRPPAWVAMADAEKLSHADCKKLIDDLVAADDEDFSSIEDLDTFDDLSAEYFKGKASQKMIEALGAFALRRKAILAQE